MLFCKNNKPSQKSSQIKRFEIAFHKRLNQTPVEFIASKLQAGSDEKAVAYLYDITAAEIARQNHCKPPLFTSYLQEAKRSLKENSTVRYGAAPSIISKASSIAICQREFLCRKSGKPFEGLCETELDSLFEDSTFYNGLLKISKENESYELSPDAHNADFLTFKRLTLPQRMEELGLTAYPDVLAICQWVESNSRSRKSALITIYYAVRMRMLKQ